MIVITRNIYKQVCLLPKNPNISSENLWKDYQTNPTCVLPISLIVLQKMWDDSSGNYISNILNIIRPENLAEIYPSTQNVKKANAVLKEYNNPGSNPIIEARKQRKIWICLLQSHVFEDTLRVMSSLPEKLLQYTLPDHWRQDLHYYLENESV